MSCYLRITHPGQTSLANHGALAAQSGLASLPTRPGCPGQRWELSSLLTPHWLSLTGSPVCRGQNWPREAMPCLTTRSRARTPRLHLQLLLFTRQPEHCTC